MINLYTELVIQIPEPGELKIDPKKWYQVIGTLNREFEKANKKEMQDLLIIVGEEEKPVNVFMSKCRIRRLDKKSLSGFDSTDFLKT